MERHPDSASSPGLRADPSQGQTAPARTWLHRLANVVVAIVVLAVAAGMFVFSYPGVHAIARQGGVSGQLARYYPGLFDAVLVIACVAAVMLRDARWWARCWAWLVALVVLAAIGVTDVLHAMSYGLRQRPTEGVVAAAPVVAVLLAFSLFLTMLRQSRPQPPDADLGQAPAREPSDGRAAGQPTAPMMFSAVDIVPAVAAGTVPRPPAPPIALPAVPADAPTAEAPGDVDRTPDGPAAATETAETAEAAEGAETAPAREIPALAAEPVNAAADRGTAVTREQPVLLIGTSAAPGTTPPPTEESDVVEPEPPSADVTPEPISETTSELMPEAPADTAEASETSAETAEPTETTETTADTSPASAETAETSAETTAASAETAAEGSDEASDEASDRPEPESAEAPAPAVAQAPAPHAIRYASSAATEQFANEDWEAEVDPALAGQVYPVLTSDPDIEVPPHQPGQSQDLEDDAPPFATAPFASVPRLNRVRATPTPPTDDADQE